MNIPEGAIAAMLTPFDDSGRVNEKEIRRLVSFLIEKGVDGLFPVASCGEYTHIDIFERKYLIDIVLDETADRVPVIPGTGATCHHQSIELANYAKEKGCAAVVLHGPYFFKNTSEVVEGHLKKVAESVEIPIFLYNIPFFANEVTPDIAERLACMPNVVGIKDSSGNMVNVMNLIEMTRKVNPDFKVLVGAEEIMLPALLMGGRGCMTATTGILPEFMVGIWQNFKDKNIDLAQRLQFAILPLIREMKSVNFPQGFKEALSIRGIDMGPPKMNYPDKTLVQIKDLKTILELEMGDLLEKFFPGVSLEYKKESSSTLTKYNYPNIASSSVKVIEKKYDDCSLCGICEGDIDRKITSTICSTANITGEITEKTDAESSNKSEDIRNNQLIDIRTKTITKMIK